MKKSRFTESQIVKILKEVEAGRMVKEVCREYGMSDALGLPTYGRGSGNPFLGREYSYLGDGRNYSEEAARAIDSEVRRILETSYETSLRIIRENHDRMVHLANTLMELETLDRTDFEKLMNEPVSNGQLPSVVEISDEENSLDEPLVEDPALDTAT